MSTPDTPSPEQQPANEIMGSAKTYGGPDGIGCLAIVGALLCGTIFAAPLGLLLIFVAVILFVIRFFRQRFFTATTAPCPLCGETLTVRGEGLRTCTHCAGSIMSVQGQLIRPEA